MTLVGGQVEMLTAMERRALLGVQAMSRELAQRHAQEQASMQEEFLATLGEIAVAHDLPEQAFHAEYGIDLQAMKIVRKTPPEEALMTPAEPDPVTEAA